MTGLGDTLAQYGWPGVIVLLLSVGTWLILTGQVVPRHWVDRWLDDKDKIIDRSLESFDKLSDAVEKNTDTVERSAVQQAGAIDKMLQSIQRMADRERYDRDSDDDS